MDKKTFGRILAKRLLEASDALASWPVPDVQPDRNIRLQLSNSLWQAALSAGQMGGVTARQARRIEPAPVVTLRTARLMAGKGHLTAKQLAESNSRLLEELAACRDLIAEFISAAGDDHPDLVMPQHVLTLIEWHKADSKELAACRDSIARLVAAADCISPSGALTLITSHSEHKKQLEKSIGILQEQLDHEVDMAEGLISATGQDTPTEALEEIVRLKTAEDRK